MWHRNLTKTLIELLKEFRIIYMTGPRQSGKTTLAKTVAKQLGMQYITLDDQASLAAATYDPQGFIYSLGTQKTVLDEFQYVPQLISAIKMVSDNLNEGQKGQFLLTGSADIFRSAKIQESLPGHMAKIELYPLSITELYNNSFNFIDFLIEQNFSQQLTSVQFSRQQLAQIVINGGYPEVQTKSARGKQIWFKSYIQGRLFKDFEQMHHARGEYYYKLQGLIPLLAGLSGNLIKYASIANTLSQNDKVVKTYMEILDLMFIIKRIDPYAKNTSKRAVLGMPKLHFIDTGLACYLRGLKSPDQLLKSNFYGGLLESYITMECFKHLAWASEEMGIYHFRDKQKNEVDIVLERDNGDIIGIEIKAAATINMYDFKGLIKLADFSGHQFYGGILLYMGTRLLPFKIDNTTFYAVPISIILNTSELQQ